MFNQMSNTTFNNGLFSFEKLQRMLPPPNFKHASLERLLSFTNETVGLSGHANLAAALLESEQTVTNWAKRGVSKAGAMKAQAKFGCSANWVLTGLLPKSAFNAASGISNVEPGPDIKGKLPLISKIQAGAWDTAFDNFSPGDADRWMACSVRHSPNSYVLRVTGDSMTATSGSGRSYPHGCYVFVDPELRNPCNGDRIIAKLACEGEDCVTFKIYKNEDGRQWLQPLNPSHEPIRDEFSVMGKVIGKWEDE